jgi:hypothetical protein
MKLKIHRNLREAVVIEATRVVVEDGFGNPVAVALEFAPNQILAATPDSPEFNAILREMGIDKTVIVEDVHPVPLDQVQFDS